MTEEFQAEVCGGSWWSSPFMPGNYGGCWQNDFMINMKTRSTDESSGGCSTTISPDSVFQMMGSPSSSSTTTNWNQALLANGRTEESYIQSLPEILTKLPADGDQNSSNFGDCSGNLVNTSYGYPSNLLQTLLENTSPPQPQQQPLYNDFQQNLNDFNPVSNNLRELSSLKPKQQINKSPFWNTSVLDLNNNRASFFGSAQPRFLSSYEEKPNCRKDLGSLAKKSSCEPRFKRPRVETPSPLPTFKVRKEKLGDRVTALQQLVSPFGKTDTASVLHEAIEYIKLLHDQVNVLSAPYMKNGPMMQRQQIHENGKHAKDGAKQHDLRSRGLCLVPVSSTFPLATDAAPDYWSSSFGSTFK